TDELRRWENQDDGRHIAHSIEPSKTRKVNSDAKLVTHAVLLMHNLSEQKSVMPWCLYQLKGLDLEFCGIRFGQGRFDFNWASTNQPIPVSDWATPNQPNNRGGDQDCIVLAKFFQYRWNDRQ
ncbi:Hypothetical predicted protein, partial [Mytilus galloprovincialis]